MENVVMLKKPYVYVRDGVSDEYRGVLERIQEAGHCPFCPENFLYHKNPILCTEEDWFITQNSWSYTNAEHRLIIISREHKESFADLSLEDFTQVMRLVQWAIAKFSISGAALALRFGNPAHTGATVQHLHFQLLSARAPQKDGKTDVVWFPIG